MDHSQEIPSNDIYGHLLTNANDTIPSTQGLLQESDADNKSHPKIVLHHAATPQSSSIPGTGSLDSESPKSRAANQLVVSKIEEYIRAIADGLHRRVEVSISLNVRKQTAGSEPPGNEQGKSETLVRFPGGNAHEAWRFAVLVRILDLLHEALINNVVVSKRNMYYKDPLLFKKQAVVDRYVDILAYTFGVQRADLNVTAAAKGLLIGDFRIIRMDGTMLRIDSSAGPNLIGDMHDHKATDCSNIAWVLIVEKESTFRTLASTGFRRNTKVGEGVILTAKGYPDLSSRALVHLLSTPNQAGTPVPPIFALMDFDPDGIAIMSTYKYGSRKLHHETADMAVPVIRWLGLQSRHLFDESKGLGGSSGFLPLSMRDRKLAKKMLGQSSLMEANGESEWRRELQTMLMLGCKAEMEILDEREGGVGGWLEDALAKELGYRERS